MPEQFIKIEVSPFENESKSSTCATLEFAMSGGAAAMCSLLNSYSGQKDVEMFKSGLAVLTRLALSRLLYLEMDGHGSVNHLNDIRTQLIKCIEEELYGVEESLTKYINGESNED